MSFKAASERGSAVTIAIVASGVVAALLLSALNLSGVLTKQVAKEQAQADVDNLRRYVETLLSEESSCSGFGAMTGITFVDATDGSEGKNKFQLTPLLTGEQEIRAVTNFKVAGGGLQKLQGPPSPSELTAFNATVNRFYVSNAVSLGGSDYQTDVFLQASSRGTQFAPRQLGTLLLSFSGTSLVSCKLKQAAQILCEDMGCKYNVGASKRKCACRLPAMSCPSSPGQPMQYIAGINATTSPPSAVCATFKASCLDRKGPGFAISGIDEDGQPICQPFEGSTAGSATPTPPPSATPAIPSTATPVPTPITCPIGRCCPGHPMLIATVSGPGGSRSCIEYQSPPMPKIDPGSPAAIADAYTAGESRHVISGFCSDGGILGSCHGEMDVVCNADGTVTYTNRSCFPGEWP